MPAYLAGPSQLFPPHGQKVAHFYENNKPNYIFANYWKKPLTIGNETFKTPEHYFQAQKFPKGSVSRNAIIDAANADDARKKAGEIIENQFKGNKDGLKKWRKQWTKDKREALRDVIRERMKQDPQFKKALMSTGNAYISEDTFQGPPGDRKNPDKFNGSGSDGMGANDLGRALMFIREQEKRDKDPNDNRTDQQIETQINMQRVSYRLERKVANDVLGNPNATKGKPYEAIVSAVKSKLSPTQYHQEMMKKVDSELHKIRSDPNKKYDQVLLNRIKRQHRDAITGIHRGKINRNKSHRNRPMLNNGDQPLKLTATINSNKVNKPEYDSSKLMKKTKKVLSSANKTRPYKTGAHKNALVNPNVGASNKSIVTQLDYQYQANQYVNVRLDGQTVKIEKTLPNNKTVCLAEKSDDTISTSLSDNYEHYQDKIDAFVNTTLASITDKSMQSVTLDHPDMRVMAEAAKQLLDNGVIVDVDPSYQQMFKLTLKGLGGPYLDKYEDNLNNFNAPSPPGTGPS